MTPEDRVKMAICEWLKYQGAFFWVSDRVGIFDSKRGVYRRNHNPYRIKGISDILGMWRGRFVAIEVKSDKGRLTPEQKTFIERVNETGGIAFMAKSVADVESVLSGIASKIETPPDSIDVSRGDVFSEPTGPRLVFQKKSIEGDFSND